MTASLIVPVDSVLQGTTIAGQTGTMPNQGAVTIVPGVTSKSIPAGYHNGSGIVSGDSDLISSNIKVGKDIFGVTGTYGGTGTHGSRVYAAPGNYSFTVPAGVTSVTAHITGGGGGGGGSGGYDNRGTGGGGGAGGTYIDVIAVTPGTVIPVVVGEAGTGGGEYQKGINGGNSSFSSYIAYGGKGGAGSEGGPGGPGGAGGGMAGSAGESGTKGQTDSSSSGSNVTDYYCVDGGFVAGKGGNGSVGAGGPGGPGKVMILW